MAAAPTCTTTDAAVHARNRAHARTEDVATPPAGGEPESPRVEEEAAFRMPPPASRWLILILAGLQSLGFVIVVPTATQYADRLGADETFGGVMISLVPLMSIVGAGISNRMLKRLPFRTVLFIMTFFSIGGHVLYALAGLTRSKWTLLAARSALGLAFFYDGIHLYVSRAVGLKRRSAVQMSVNVFNAGAYAFAPFCQFLLEVFLKELRIENLILDSDTAPGWFMAIAYSAFLFFMFLLFEEPPAETLGAGGAHQTGRLSPSQWPLLSLAGSFWVVFAVPVVISSCDIFTALLSQQYWGWPVSASALHLSGVMACVVPSTLLMGRYAHTVPDRRGMLVGSFTCLASSLFLFDFGLQGLSAILMYTSGLVVFVTAATTVRGFVMALVTKLVPTHLKARAVTYMTVCYLVGRGSGSIIGAALTPKFFGPVQLAIWSSCCAVMLATYGRLTPHAKAS